MRKLARVAIPLIGIGTLVMVRCVGDSGTPGDGGGPDATQNDGSPADGSTNDGSPSDGSPGDAAPPQPTPDGGILWFNHYNMNQGLNDISVPDSQGNMVIVGSLRTCSSCNSSNT